MRISYAQASLPIRKILAAFYNFMKLAKTRQHRPRTPRNADEPLPDELPPRPDFLLIDDQHVIWRNSARPAPNHSIRPITWDVQFLSDSITVRADLDREGEMREVDFREVRGRLDEILLSVEMVERSVNWHTQRIRHSSYWQRKSDDRHWHLDPPLFYDKTGCWTFGMSHPTAESNKELGGPVLRPASNEMYLERREERQWAAYAQKQLEWASKHSLDTDFIECYKGARDICRLRLLHYWQIPECRELFSASKNFTTLFCAVELVPELNDILDSEWKETVTRLARLPHRELMGHIGLPPTDQAVQLFLRLKPRVIVPDWSLIQEAFANPLAIERLSETSCGIDEMMLRICPREDFPFHWPLFRELCCNGPTCDPALSYIHYEIDFFPDGPIGRHVRKFYLNARSAEELKKATRIAGWYRRNWHGLFKPGVRDAHGNLITLLPETENIRLLNRPEELINISNENELSLNQYMILTSEGKYVLYKVNYQDEFAVVGICRTENGPWKIDQIMGTKNAEASVELRNHVMEWYQENFDLL